MSDKKQLVAFWATAAFKKKLQARARSQEHNLSQFVRLVLLRELELQKASEAALKSSDR